MIQTKHLISAILFCSPLSLSALDINDSVKIIEEASKATKGLQEDFSQLTEEQEPIQEELNSVTTGAEVTAQEVIVVEEHNETIQESNATENKIQDSTKEYIQTIQEPTVLVETNETLQGVEEVTPETSIVNNISIVESNTSTTIETNTSLEENQTIVQESRPEEEEGSFTKGMVIFKTKLKAICKMTGDEFAKNYTQEDWDDIYDNDEFEKVVYELCPAMKGKYDKKWTKDLYQFSLKYASDSDEIPEC